MSTESPAETIIEQIEVTPTPRVLSMLGEIEFAPWRCLAELCDNSFDHGLSLIRQGKLDPDDNFRVSVVLPKSSDSAREAEVTVMDTGEGMTLAELNNAVRAGWTGNDPFENLGLFGMGFNIATARLGQRTRVMTTKRGDTHWVGVEIDLRELQERGTFEVPVVREQKDDPDVHGTRIQVSRLNAGNYEDLTGNRIRRTRERLGDVYAPLLLEHAATIELRVNGQVVTPRNYCVWDDSRTVHYSGANAGEIPAVIRFAHELPEGAACDDCRRWQDKNNTACQFCESNNLSLRPRYIHGWVGVQRYLDTSDYGIDFVRNGRKILIRDKQLFTWDDPNSLSNDGLIEYPVEPPANNGRLIGQVHIDHVPVEYKKTTFVDGPEWKAVRDFIRGDGGPLRPNTRREAGYPGLADGPLGKLYRAFNANRPGARHLIPGNGTQALHEKAREWGKKFHDGDPDYQDDAVWWAAVQTHERIASAGADADFSDLFSDADDQTKNVLIDMFGDDAFTAPEPSDSDDHDDETIDDTEDSDDSDDEPTETWRERCERWVEDYPVIPDLDFDVAVPGASSAVHMTTYLVGEPVLNEHNQRAPVFSRLLSHVNQLAVFVDEKHPLFTRFDTPTVDIVFAEVADWFRGRFHSTMSISEIISRLKEEKLPDRRLDARISEEAAAILEKVREAMAAALDAAGDNAVPKVAELLSPRERADTEQASESRDGRTFVDASKDGGIVRYVPAITLPRVVEALPSVFFDGKVFVRKHDLLQEDNQATRRLNVARIVGYLYDLGILADQPVKLKGDALRRAALSIPLIGGELADVEAVADAAVADTTEPAGFALDG